MKAQVFLSHSHQDSELVQALEQFIESGTGGAVELFNTSSRTQGIKPGADWVRAIDRSLETADVVLAVISDNYRDSEFCLVELGAAWALAKRTIPLICPPVRQSK